MILFRMLKSGGENCLRKLDQHRVPGHRAGRPDRFDIVEVSGGMMSLIEFLFAEFSPRRYLDHAVYDCAVDDRARQLATASISAETELQATRLSLQKVEARVAELENDMGFLTLTVGMLIQALEDKTVVNKNELRKQLQSIDLVDGVADGRFDVNLLRKKLSIPPNQGPV